MLRIRQSIRYLRIPRASTRQFTQYSAVFDNYHHAHQIQDLKQQIELLMEKVPNNKDKDAPSILQKIVTQIPEDKSSILAANVLALMNASSKNFTLLELALQTVKSQDISDKTLDNLITIVHKLSVHKSIPKEIQNLLITIFLNRCNDDIIEKLRSGLEQYVGGFNKHVLVTLLLKTKQYDEAYELVLRTLQEHGKIRHISIELLIHHLCHIEEIGKASELLDHAIKEQHVIFPRTYSVFLSKAIELNEYKICSQFQKHIMERTYVDNGTLVRLVECLVHKDQYFQIIGLRKVALQKDSFPVEFLKRIDRSIVECAARIMEFKHAWIILERYHHRGSVLEVVDYPNLKAKLEVDDFEKVNQLLHEKMTLEDLDLKKFILNLVIARLSEDSNVDMALHLINRSLTLLPYINENTILQLTHGADITQDSDALSKIIELIEKQEMRFNERKTVDLLLSTLLETDYWFQSFKILERCDIKDYKMRPEVFSKLDAKCEQYGSTQHLQYK